MGSVKSLAQGFLVAAGIIWIFNVASLIKGGRCIAGLDVFADSDYARIQLNPS
jgi:hypothetical protein